MRVCAGVYRSDDDFTHAHSIRMSETALDNLQIKKKRITQKTLHNTPTQKCTIRSCDFPVVCVMKTSSPDGVVRTKYCLKCEKHIDRIDKLPVALYLQDKRARVEEMKRLSKGVSLVRWSTSDDTFIDDVIIDTASSVVLGRYNKSDEKVTNIEHVDDQDWLDSCSAIGLEYYV